MLYPVYFLLQAAFDVGDPDARPPTAYGFDNFAALADYRQILLNTLVVSFAAAVMALVFGFLTAWILNRTDVPVPPHARAGDGGAVLRHAAAGRARLEPARRAGERLHQPGLARAWAAATPLIDITGPIGIAWVMALFEGSVAFVMIGAVMKSMDPSLEEASQVIGGGRLRTMLRVTLPLVAPGVLGAGIFVFAEMLGSFSAALVLGLPNRFYVITTAIYQLVSQYPPRIPLAAAMGVSLFAVMFVMLFLYRRLMARRQLRHRQRQGVPAAADGGRRGCAGCCSRSARCTCCCRWCCRSLTLIYASVQKLAVALAGGRPTSRSTISARRWRSTRCARRWCNSLLLGLLTATIGVFLTGLLAWMINRSRLPGRGALEYVVMFPQAVPRLVFAFGMMWAWLAAPVPIYGTFWLLLIAYLTVFLPLGVRTISGVLVQLDKSLEECGQVCGASWGYRMRTITMPLLRPGLLAAWLLLFIAAVRELGASILLMGPNSKVLTPAIVEAFFASCSELTAAMALIQTAVVGVVMVVFTLATRRLARVGA